MGATFLANASRHLSADALRDSIDDLIADASTGAFLGAIKLICDRDVNERNNTGRVPRRKRSEILLRQSDGASSIQQLLVELQTVSQTKIFSYIFERNFPERGRAEGLRSQWGITRSISLKQPFLLKLFGHLDGTGTCQMRLILLHRHSGAAILLTIRGIAKGAEV